MPVLNCLKKTGPFDSNFISNPSKGIIQDKINMATNELTKISRNRFFNLLPMSSSGSALSDRIGISLM